MAEPPADAGQLLEALAVRAGEVMTEDTPAGREYRRDGRVFAAHQATAVELRLDPEVAEAARRTPDSGPSERGPEWVRFTPTLLDRHAADRIEAWFLSAWRAAGGGR
ncbi:MAG TPA: hypothetical protein VNT28_07135 [Candidatus Limnocylindrales bacterium]|jgi:hypothetical protein|nr:hypothetical protein [Candidatus Limnocylindrales bacterium]